MFLFCPRCNSKHLVSSRCPRCSSRLLAPAEASDLLPTRTALVAPPPPPVMPGFGGRIVVGTLVALGLHLALWEWAVAIAGVFGAEDLSWHLWLGYGLRLAGAVVGGVLAGAGRPKSFSTGAVVGGACAIAWLTVDAFPHLTFDVVRVVAGCLLSVLAGVCAVVGGAVWPPPVEVKPPKDSHRSSLFRLKTSDGQRRGRPIAWVRVGLGVTVAVGGVLGAELVRQVLAKFPQGTFNGLAMTARSDAMISGFIGLFAGVVAGASTGHGWRQGAIAGFISAMAVAIISASLPDGPPLAVQFAIDSVGQETPSAGVGTACATLFAVVSVGGWFGGQLIPALRRKKRLDG
jgi:hypothetical protein